MAEASFSVCLDKDYRCTCQELDRLGLLRISLSRGSRFRQPRIQLSALFRLAIVPVI